MDEGREEGGLDGWMDGGREGWIFEARRERHMLERSHDERWQRGWGGRHGGCAVEG